LSSSRSGLSLAAPAQKKNAINDKKQIAPYTSKMDVIIWRLASPRTNAHVGGLFQPIYII